MPQMIFNPEMKQKCIKLKIKTQFYQLLKTRILPTDWESANHINSQWTSNFKQLIFNLLLVIYLQLLSKAKA